jgi:hypothetical protein
VLLDCEEGVVDVIWGGTREDEVGGVRWGEEGNVGIGILDHLVGGGSVLFVKSVEFGPRGGGGSGGGHQEQLAPILGDCSNVTTHYFIKVARMTMGLRWR